MEKQMTAAERRKFLERIRQLVIYDILKREDCDRITRICTEAMRREANRMREEKRSDIP